MDTKRRNEEDSKYYIFIWKFISFTTVFVGVITWLMVAVLLIYHLSIFGIGVLPSKEIVHSYNNRLVIYLVLSGVMTLMLLFVIILSLRKEEWRKESFKYILGFMFGLLIILWWMIIELIFMQLASIGGAILFIVSLSSIFPVILIYKHYCRLGDSQSYIQSTSISLSYAAFGTAIAIFLIDKI